MKTLFSILILTSIGISSCSKDTGVVLAKDHESYFDGAVYAVSPKYLMKIKLVANNTGYSSKQRQALSQAV